MLCAAEIRYFPNQNERDEYRLTSFLLSARTLAFKKTAALSLRNEHNIHDRLLFLHLMKSDSPAVPRPNW